MARRTVVPWAPRPVVPVLVVLLFAVAWVPVAQAAPVAPIPMAPDLEDDLALVERDWNVTTALRPYRMDVLGLPREGDVEVAYRFHNDIAALEGTITRPRPTTGQPHSIYNTGMRLHAIGFDPALGAGDRSMSLLYPGPLDWSGLERVSAAAGVQRFAAWAPVPVPGGDGVSPPDNGTEAWSDGGGRPMAWMVWTVELDNATAGDPFTVLASPANVRFAYLLFVDAALVDPEPTYNLTTTLHFDFGGQADGIAVAGPAPLQTDGLYLNRSHVYAMLRLVDRVHAPLDGAARPGGPDAPLAIRYEAEAGFAAPTRDASRVLISPITFNVTHGLLPLAEGANVTLAGSPATEARALYGVRLDGEFGYQRHDASKPPETATPTPSDPAGEDAPALGVPGLVLALMGAAWAGRHRRARRGAD